MMRYRSSRLSALFTAVVFLLIGAGDVFGLHSCPHHENASPGHGQAAAEHDGTAHHSAHHGEEAGTPAGGADHSGGPCICGGSCPAVSLAPLPATSISIVEIFPAAVQPVGIRDRIAPRERFLPFFLPYANAPPLIG